MQSPDSLFCVAYTEHRRRIISISASYSYDLIKNLTETESALFRSLVVSLKKNCGAV
jgi:hypothetical protein